jgi:L,D-transpeptidase ErfK/SrfK
VLDNRHIVPAAPGVSIVINIPQRMLFHVEAETAPVGYPIAVGRRNWPTPVGPFEIVAKEEHPTWDVPPSIQEEMRRSGQRVLTRVPPGPSNPLGEYWFGLSLPGIGIHGTPAFTSIYRPATHGCIRVHPDDIAELFPKVAVGTTGLIVYEPMLIAVVDGTLFLEAHPDVYGRAPGDAVSALRRHLDSGAVEGRVDWAMARGVLDRRDGIARAIGSSAGSPQQAQ